MNRGEIDFKYEKPTVGFLDKIPDPVGFLGTCPGTYPVQPWFILKQLSHWSHLNGFLHSVFSNDLQDSFYEIFYETHYI